MIKTSVSSATTHIGSLGNNLDAYTACNATVIYDLPLFSRAFLSIQIYEISTYNLISNKGMNIYD